MKHVRENNGAVKYRIYKGHRMSSRGGAKIKRNMWKIAFMTMIIGCVKTFDEAVQIVNEHIANARKVRQELGV